MIILNEANKVKQFAADKLGIELPKGGRWNPNNPNNNNDDMFHNDIDASGAARDLSSPVTPNKVKEYAATFRHYDKHNLPYKVADNNDKLHRLHQGINKSDSARVRKDELMKTYGDKLTHKYDKLFTHTPEVESPKSTSKPSNSKPPKVEAPNNGSWFSRNKGKVALGVGVTTAAAYGIHKYKKNKKKKEEEARRQAELAQKKSSKFKRFLNR